MIYLKKVVAGKEFIATFTNREVTQSLDTAYFFMMMQDKKIEPRDLASHIRLVRLVEPSKDWKEIERIANTFSKRQGSNS